VRIAVTVGASRVELSGRSIACSPIEGGAPLPAGARAEVALEGSSLTVNGAAAGAEGVRCAGAGALRHAGLELDGDLEVRRGARGLDVVHAAGMEEYVAAVSGAEMPASFPAEALKAQAVAARTFAVGKKLEAVTAGRPWHLGATVVHQVYRGPAADPRAVAAAEATAGEVLVFDHEPADAFFHSTCGGHTEAGGAALGRERPYLPGVPCGRCDASPLSRWTVRLGDAELGRALGFAGAVTALRVVERSPSGRAARVEVDAGGARARLAGADLRQRLGWSKLPSLAFDVRRERGAFRFDGRGSGHGAGMCQWGAAGLAREGAGYRDILARYYPGAELRRMY
jgi:stage II sporulation protein D